MKILAIMGSSRKNSNTDKFLELFVKKFKLQEEDLEKYTLRDLNYDGCISCYGCGRVPKCVVKDDLTEIYSKIEEADLIIVSTPIYFNSVSSLTKQFIDRTQVYWSRKFILKLGPIKEKYGIALINGGAFNQENQFLGSELVFDHFFKATSCKKNMFVEVSNTDRFPINENNDEFVSFLDSIKLDFNISNVYRLEGGINEN
ncbi:flavodoxin family protein [Peptoniphilus mikwangii]|uniref:flavodoxin family protein n=1 Tax=Peptoniphilus mikwangii TaxID=1354300 RepID=UPI00042615ED|nr:flavodoxin family protein [Peptoniphilus mikwangii]